MPSRLWKVQTDEKKLYLTFDDGPIPGLTEWVLDLLLLKKAKATFFCVGANIEKHADIFSRIKAEGHSIGNHSHNHLNGWESKTQEYLDNVLACQQVIEKQKVETRLFRPPYGRLKWQQRKVLSAFTIVMWDVLSKDYLQTLEPKDVLAESIKATEPGSIIVFHDNLKAEKNLKFALPRYIDHFQQLGFEFDVLL